MIFHLYVDICKYIKTDVHFIFKLLIRIIDIDYLLGLG